MIGDDNQGTAIVLGRLQCLKQIVGGSRNGNPDYQIAGIHNCSLDGLQMGIFHRLAAFPHAQQTRLRNLRRKAAAPRSIEENLLFLLYHPHGILDFLLPDPVVGIFYHLHHGFHGLDAVYLLLNTGFLILGVLNRQGYFQILKPPEAHFPAETDNTCLPQPQFLGQFLQSHIYNQIILIRKQKIGYLFLCLRQGNVILFD